MNAANKTSHHTLIDMFARQHGNIFCCLFTWILIILCGYRERLVAVNKGHKLLSLIHIDVELINDRL